MEATKMRVKNKYFSITPNVVEKMKERYQSRYLKTKISFWLEV